MSYEDFVKGKRRSEVATGHAPGELNENLFDFQHAIVSWAVRRGRAAIFADTGLGKTLMQLAWADEVSSFTNGIVVILAPLAVSEQTIEQWCVWQVVRVGISLAKFLKRKATMAQNLTANVSRRGNFNARARHFKRAYMIVFHHVFKQSFN